MAFGMQKLQSDICEQSKQLRATIDTKSSNHAHFTKFCARSLHIKNSVYKTHTHTHTQNNSVSAQTVEYNQFALCDAKRVPTDRVLSEQNKHALSKDRQKLYSFRVMGQIWSRIGFGQVTSQPLYTR